MVAKIWLIKLNLLPKTLLSQQNIKLSLTWHKKANLSCYLLQSVSKTDILITLY